MKTFITVCSLFLFNFSFAQNNYPKDSCAAADEHYYKKRYKETIVAATSCINSETNNDKLILSYSFRSSAYEQLKEYDKALLDINKVVSMSPTIGNIRSRAALYATMGKFDLALQDHDKAISISPDSDMEYYFKGKCLVKAQRYDDATSVLQTALKINPKNSYITTELGKIALINNDYTKAKEYFDRAYKDNYGAHEPFYYQGVLSMHDGDFRKAISYFNDAFKYDWTDGNTLIQRAIAYAWLYKPDSAKTDLEKAKNLKHESQLLTNATIILRSQEIPEINPEIIQSNNKEFLILYQRSHQLKKEKRLKEAFKQISAAIKLEPKNSYVYSLSSEITLSIFQMNHQATMAESDNFDFEKNDDWWLAMDDAKTAIQLNPDNFAAYYLRANMYLDLKKYKLAQSDLEKCLKLINANPYYESGIKKMIGEIKAKK